MRLFRRIREAAEVVRKSVMQFPATKKSHNCEVLGGGKFHKRDSWKRVFELTSPNSLLRSRTCTNFQKRKCALERSFSPRLPPRVRAPADADGFRLAERDLETPSTSTSPLSPLLLLTPPLTPQHHHHHHRALFSISPCITHHRSRLYRLDRPAPCPRCTLPMAARLTRWSARLHRLGTTRPKECAYGDMQDET